MEIELGSVLERDPSRPARAYLKGTIIEPGLALNEVATSIYGLLDGQRSLADIVDAIVAEYDVDEQTCRNDVLTVARELIDEGAVVVKRTAGSNAAGA